MNKSPELRIATQRALSLFDNTGIGADPFEKAIGIAQGTIKNLKNGKNLISADCIIKFAHYFNVSADYLLCLTDEPTPLKQPNIAKQTTTALSTELAELSQDKTFIDTAKLYQRLTDMERGIAIGFIIDMLKHRGVDTRVIIGY